MEEKKSLKERIAARVEQWKQELEELNVQLHLGRKEAEEKFTEQKKHFRAWLERQKDRLDELQEDLGEEAQSLRARFRELGAYLDEDKEPFTDQKKKIYGMMRQVQEKIKAAGAKGSEKAKDLLDDWDDDLDKFKSRFDWLAMQFKLGKKEAQEEVAELKAEASEKFKEWKEKMGDLSEDAGEKWEFFRSEFKDAFASFTKKFRGKMKEEDEESDNLA